MTQKERILGCLLGTAVGDALGLPAEGLTPQRQKKLFGEIKGYRMLFGKGLVSDDTDHAVMTAEALIASGGDPALFERHLANGLRRWLLCGPPGIGFATLRACLKLLMGFPPSRSGLSSAGNGPAMRAAILGVCCGHHPQLLQQLVHLSSRMTHTDPRAEAGALEVARAAFELATAENALSVQEYVNSQGWERGVSGFVLQTVPASLYAARRHPNSLREALLDIIACGGDTDSTAAIVGGIVGARVGSEGIPAEWLSGLWSWPYTPAYMERLAERLADLETSPKPCRPPSAHGLPLRNLLLTLTVFAHIFRRALPF